MKCKPYSEITVEIRTQLKTVKITSNIFAVYSSSSILLQFVSQKSIHYFVLIKKQILDDQLIQSNQLDNLTCSNTQQSFKLLVFSNLPTQVDNTKEIISSMILQNMLTNPTIRKDLSRDNLQICSQFFRSGNSYVHNCIWKNGKPHHLGKF